MIGSLELQTMFVDLTPHAHGAHAFCAPYLKTYGMRARIDIGFKMCFLVSDFTTVNAF